MYIIRSLKFFVKKIREYRNDQKYKPIVSGGKKLWREKTKYYKPNKCKVILAEAPNIIYRYSTVILANLLAIKHQAIVIYLNPSQQAPLRLLEKSSRVKSKHIFVSDLVMDKEDLIHQKTRELVNSINTPGELLTLKYQGLLIGDLIYDSSMVIPPAQGTVWSIDDRVYKTVYSLVCYAEAIKELENQYDIVATTYTHTIGIEVGGFPIRYFANKKITGYSGAIGLGGLLCKHQSFNGLRLHSTAVMPTTVWEEIWGVQEYRAKVLQKATAFIENRFKGKQIKDFDASKAFSPDKKEYKSKAVFAIDYKLDANKPIAFVMLHAFNDYPHHFAKNIFTDYYRWFIETLKITLETPHVNWVFKEHPNAAYYPDDINPHGIFEVIDRENIVFLDRNHSFNSTSLQYISDATITCIGTAALEFSCFGVPAIVAGESSFTGYGICHEPETYEGYKYLLNNIGNPSICKTLSEETKDKAKLIFYIIYHLSYAITPINKGIFPDSTFEEYQNAHQEEERWIKYIAENIDTDVSRELLHRVEKFINDDNRVSLMTTEDVLLR